MNETAHFVSVAARPLRIDLSRTAVLVIDMQNDFAAPAELSNDAFLLVIKKLFGRVATSCDFPQTLTKP